MFAGTGTGETGPIWVAETSRELIAVGDPDQSIYAFRGADVRALTGFPGRFRAPEAAAAESKGA